MLSRLFSRSFNLRYLTLISSNTPIHSPLPPPPPPSCRPFFLNPNSIFTKTSRCFSSNRNNNGDDPPVSSSWSISQNEVDVDSIFGEAGGGDLTGIVDGNDGIDNRVKNNASDDSWSGKGGGDSWSSKGGGDVFSEIDKEFVSDSWSSKGGGDVLSEIDKEFVSEKGAAPSGGGGWVDEWDKEAGGDKGWSFGEEDKNDVFDMGEIMGEGGKLTGLVDEEAVRKKAEENALLEREKEVLSAQLKGTNRAFGDLITASGITNEMLDSLILMKDLEGIEGLPPLHVLEDRRLQKNENKTTNAEIERKKQEEIAKSRVRQVDEKGRAYGTGRRKCSIARVWIEPGQGQFVVNDKPFDTYFPVLDHRADLLRPFSETKTLGLWDVKCTVKGGGVSGQVGAIQLGVSRALQNWEPGLRPPLRAAGFLTRDSRVVERKKPGKAKARKSFQWVKR